MAYALFNALAEKQRLAPYVQSTLMHHTWPENLVITDPHFHDSNEDDYFHPSTHAMVGEKALYEMLHPERRPLLKKKDRDFSGYMTPIMGSIYHAVIQENLVTDGLVTEDDIEIPLVNEARHWRGHADLRFRGELWDIKSMNSRSFYNVAGPYRSWRYQLHPYMDHMGLDSSGILVVEMGIPWGMKEFTIGFQQSLLDEIYTKWENVTKAIQSDTPPTTCCTTEENAKYCPIRCGGKLAP